MLKSKAIICLLLSALLLGCSSVSKVSHRVLRVEQLCDHFCKKRVGDLRENMFSIEVEKQNSDLIVRGKVDSDSLKVSFLRYLTSEGIDFKEDIRVLPDSVVGDKCWGLIDLSCANLRSAPRHSAEMGTQALLGTPVRVLDKEGSWFCVQTPDKYIAWVDAAGVSLKTKDEMEFWKRSNRIIVTVDYTYLYSTSEDDTVLVSDLVMGDILQVIGQTEGGFNVALPDGRTGFVKKRDAEGFAQWCSRINPNAKNLITLGRMFMGRPYLWGGTSPKAMDCSGFVKTLYFNNGVILARDASLQTHNGELVKTELDWSNLQPGDLVFFGKPSTENSRERVTHVGMYVGDSEFIHCAGKVKINSFDNNRDNYSNYRTISLIRGRRVLSCINTKGISLVSNHPWYVQQ